METLFQNALGGVAVSWRWLEAFKGEPCRAWMIDHPELPVVVGVLYLALVLYVPERWMKTRRPFNLARLNAVWNFALAVFAVVGVYFTCARLGAMLSSGLSSSRGATEKASVLRRSREAWYAAVCVWKDENFFDGPVGFFVLAFVLSKPLEMFDTVFLVAQKKNVIFLHWYHHVTVMFYCWHAYTFTISSGLVFAVMNYAVHSVMYFYYFFCSCGLRRTMRPIAPFITLMQILQMVFGVGVEIGTYYLATYTERGCDVSRQNSKLGLAMYLSYLALFVKLFYDNYICGKGARKREEKPLMEIPVSNGTPYVPQKNGHSTSISNGNMKGRMPNKKNA